MEVSAPAETKFIKTEYQKLEGPKILDKIELPDEKKRSDTTGHQMSVPANGHNNASVRGVCVLLIHINRSCSQASSSSISTDFLVHDDQSFCKLKIEKDLEMRWNSYQKRFSYAEEIEFADVIDTAIELVKKMEMRALSPGNSHDE